MSRKLLYTATWALTLAACAPEPITIDDGGAFESPEADLELAPASLEMGSDDGSDNDSGEQPEDPPGQLDRFTFMGDEDGDFVFHATVAAAVRERYDGAAEYRVRLSGDGVNTLVELVDGNGETLEMLRTARDGSLFFADGEDAAQLCFPYPLQPPVIDGCVYDPCPWDQWPEPGPIVPDCLEVAVDGNTTFVRGGIGGRSIAFDVENVDGEASVTMLAEPLVEAEAQRIDDARAVLEDVNLLAEAIEPMQTGCIKCHVLKDAFIIMAGLCVLEPPTCVGLVFAIDPLVEACKDCG